MCEQLKCLKCHHFRQKGKQLILFKPDRRKAYFDIRILYSLHIVL